MFTVCRQTSSVWWQNPSVQFVSSCICAVNFSSKLLLMLSHVFKSVVVEQEMCQCRDLAGMASDKYVGGEMDHVKGLPSVVNRSLDG